MEIKPGQIFGMEPVGKCRGCGQQLVHPDDWGDYDDACEWGCTGCGPDENVFKEVQ